MAGNDLFNGTQNVTPTTSGDVYSDEDDDEVIPSWVHGVGGVGMVTLIVLAVVGNLLVIISYFRDKQLQTVHNMYILNLAVTDFFLGAISMAFYADFTLRSWTWIFGRVFCKVWCINDYSMCLQSVFLMLLLSLDRVILLRNGAEYLAKETKKVARIKLAISWSIAFAIYGPCVLFWDVARGYSVIADDYCDAEFIEQLSFGIAAAIFELTLPFITLSVLNCVVFIAIRRQLKLFDKRKANNVAPSKAVKETKDIATVSKEVDAIKGKDILNMGKKYANFKKPKTTNINESANRKDLKAAKSLTVLVIAFFLCWAPYTISTLVSALCGDCINQHVYEFFTWLLWAKSSINPLLYASQSKRFKENFLRLLPFLRFCKLIGNRS